MWSGCPFTVAYTREDQMHATQIVYTVRVSDDAFMEITPEEITEFMEQGFVPDIRIMPAR